MMASIFYEPTLLFHFSQHIHTTKYFKASGSHDRLIDGRIQTLIDTEKIHLSEAKMNDPAASSGVLNQRLRNKNNVPYHQMY
jgi:hypothetical protein